MSPDQRDPQWEFLERWLSGPPPAPPEIGPVRRVLRWCQNRPWLAASVSVSLFGGLLIWAIGLWGWVQSTRTISQLKAELWATQQQLTDSQDLIQQQKQHIARATERLQEAETRIRQTQQHYQQACQQIEQLTTRCQTLQSQNARLQQEHQIIWALQLARQAQDEVFLEPERSVLLASEAARILLDHGCPPQLSLQQTLQDALVQMGRGRLEGQPPGVCAVTLSRDGRWLLTGGEDRNVRVWHFGAEGLALARVLRAHKGSINHIFLTPDQRALITIGQDGQIFLWNFSAKQGAWQPVLLGVHQGPILAATLSSDGRWLLAAGGSPFQKEYPAHLWDLEAQPPGARHLLLRGHELPVRCVAISPDLRWAITAGEDRTIRLYHLQAKYPAAEQRILTGHPKPVLRVAVSPDSRWLVSAGADGTVRIWDLGASDPASAVMLLQGHTEAVEALAIDAQSRWLATGSTDGTVRLWDLRSPNPAAGSILLKGHEGPVHCLLFTPDGQALLSGSGDRTVRIWNLAASDPNERAVILRGHSGGVRLMSLSEDGRLLVTASDGTPDSRDCVIRFWRIRPEDLLEEARAIVKQKFNSTEREEILASLRPLAGAAR